MRNKYDLWKGNPFDEGCSNNCRYNLGKHHSRVIENEVHMVPYQIEVREVVVPNNHYQLDLDIS